MTWRGFTLVELIVVIAIITAMASVTTIISVPNYVARKNDMKRRADLELIRTALEKFKQASATREYPVMDQSGLPTALQAYISPYPTDPKSSNYYYYFPVATSGKYYKYNLCAAQDYSGNREQGSNACGGNACGAGGVVCYYMVNQP